MRPPAPSHLDRPAASPPGDPASFPPRTVPRAARRGAAGPLPPRAAWPAGR